MEIINEEIISNPDMRFVILEARMTAGEEVSMLERYDASVYEGEGDWSGFVHAQHFEGAGVFDNIENAPMGIQTNSVAGAHVALTREPMRLRDFRPVFRAVRPGTFRLIFGYFKRGRNWQPKDWECPTCRIAIRVLINVLLTSASLPSPDILEIFGFALPDDWLVKFLEKINAAFDEEHPVRQALTEILEEFDLRKFSLGFIANKVCVRLGICSPDD